MQLFRKKRPMPIRERRRLNRFPGLIGAEMRNPLSGTSMGQVVISDFSPAGAKIRLPIAWKCISEFDLFISNSDLLDDSTIGKATPLRCSVKWQLGASVGVAFSDPVDASGNLPDFELGEV